MIYACINTKLSGRVLDLNDNIPGSNPGLNTFHSVFTPDTAKIQKL